MKHTSSHTCYITKYRSSANASKVIQLAKTCTFNWWTQEIWEVRKCVRSQKGKAPAF